MTAKSVSEITLKIGPIWQSQRQEISGTFVTEMVYINWPTL